MKSINGECWRLFWYLFWIDDLYWAFFGGTLLRYKVKLRKRNLEMARRELTETGHWLSVPKLVTCHIFSIMTAGLLKRRTISTIQSTSNMRRTMPVNKSDIESFFIISSALETSIPPSSFLSEGLFFIISFNCSRDKVLEVDDPPSDL
jgi:hypothetical protein